MTSSLIKIVVFDIDDTLLPRGKKKLSEKVKDRINQLHKRGIITIPATGRGIYNTPEEIIKVLKPPFIITINGHIVLNQKHEVITKHSMNDELANNLQTICIENEISLIFKYENCYRSIYENQTFDKPAYIDCIDSSTGSPYGCFLVPPPSFPMQMLMDKFPELSFTKGGAGYDVYERNADKSTGIETVLNELKLSWENVICFGDAENDISMIQKAGLGIAMGNACEALKKEADMICASSADDGIASILTSLMKL